MNPAPRNPTRLSLPRAARTLFAAAALVALASCGGGADPEAGVVQFASQMRALGVAPATLTTTLADDVTVTADMVMDWAEYKFPDLFPKAGSVRIPSVVVDGVTYNARAYSGAWGVRYLGITPDGRIFGLGDFTAQRLQQFETISFWAVQVLADRCAVNPASCGGTNQPAGAFNNCSLPAAQALRTGNRLTATYALSGSTTGEFRLEGEVQGPGTFNGQSAVRLFSRIQTTGTVQGVTSTSTTESISYEQDAGGGFTRVVGVEATTTVAAATLPGVGNLPASVTSNRTIFNPASVNVEMSIQPGQSITKAVSTTSTSTTNGVSLPAVTGSSAETHTFVRRESITVRGRSYNTCRYTITDPASVAGTGTTTSWIIDGLGIAVRTESVSSLFGQTQTEVTELVSGTFNGAPL